MSLMPPQDYRKTEYTHRMGLAADRPAAADVLPGTLYFSTDTFVVERSNGTTWDSYMGIVNPLPSLTLSSDDPQLVLYETDGPIDEKFWRIIPSAGDLLLQTFDDALSASNTPLKFTRAGEVSETIVFSTNSLPRTTLNLDGRLDHAYGVAFTGQGGGLLSADETVWNPTGLGTAYLFQVLSTNNWLIQGIHEQAAGYMMVIRSRESNAFNITITHDDPAAISQDRIMCPGSANFTLAAGHSVTLMYDGFGLNWLVIGNTM